MAAVEEFKPGGYRFIPGGFQFSGGVAAAAGFEIRRYRFRAPMPLMKGFARIEAIITAAGRPLTAFCACELRSPGQFTEQGFREFNESYVVTLGKWGVYLSGDRSAHGAWLSCVFVHGAGRRRCGAELRDFRERGGEGDRGQLSRAHHPIRRTRR